MKLGDLPFLSPPPEWYWYCYYKAWGHSDQPVCIVSQGQSSQGAWHALQHVLNVYTYRWSIPDACPANISWWNCYSRQTVGEAWLVVTGWAQDPASHRGHTVDGRLESPTMLIVISPTLVSPYSFLNSATSFWNSGTCDRRTSFKSYGGYINTANSNISSICGISGLV